MCNKQGENANDNNGAGNVPCVNCFSINMVVYELRFMILQLWCNFSKRCFKVCSLANGISFAFIPQLPDCPWLKYLSFGKRGKLSKNWAESCICDWGCCFLLFLLVCFSSFPPNARTHACHLIFSYIIL